MFLLVRAKHLGETVGSLFRSDEFGAELLEAVIDIIESDTVLLHGFLKVFYCIVSWETG